MSDSDTSCVLHPSAAGVTELRDAPAPIPASTQHTERFFCSFCSSVSLHRLNSTFPSLLGGQKSGQKATPHILVFLTKVKCLARALLFCLKQVKRLHLENRKLKGLKEVLKVHEFGSFHCHLCCWHVSGTALSSHLMPCLSLCPITKV